MTLKNTTINSPNDSQGEFVIHSVLGKSIKGLGRLRQSLLFAELANIAYLPLEQVTRFAQPLGFNEIELFNRDGSQAYLFSNHTDAVIVCRGTEPNDWNDIKADVDAVSVVAETVGRVHRGFKKEVDDLWPELEKTLVSNNKTLWFAGHSLGGAMATICAGRCFLSHIPSMPHSLYTYGSPRVGNQRYINYCDLDHIRWVNNNDIVTRSPPVLFGYRHTGTEFYLDSHGHLRKVDGWQRTKDRCRGLLGGLRNWKIDYFSDHLMDDYIKAIHNMVLEYEASDCDDESHWLSEKSRWGRKSAKKAMSYPGTEKKRG
ncbi:MAG: lipase family protein [Gammaproteobacteria bacterium]|nr:lipase family protein [Gammaproteobacteria bacterium]